MFIRLYCVMQGRVCVGVWVLGLDFLLASRINHSHLHCFVCCFQFWHYLSGMIIQTFMEQSERGVLLAFYVLLSLSQLVLPKHHLTVIFFFSNLTFQSIQCSFHRNDTFYTYISSLQMILIKLKKLSSKCNWHKEVWEEIKLIPFLLLFIYTCGYFFHWFSDRVEERRQRGGGMVEGEGWIEGGREKHLCVRDTLIG